MFTDSLQGTIKPTGVQCLSFHSSSSPFSCVHYSGMFCILHGTIEANRARVKLPFLFRYFILLNLLLVHLMTPTTCVAYSPIPSKAPYRPPGPGSNPLPVENSVHSEYRTMGLNMPPATRAAVWRVVRSSAAAFAATLLLLEPTLRRPALFLRLT